MKKMYKNSIGKDFATLGRAYVHFCDQHLRAIPTPSIRGRCQGASFKRSGSIRTLNTGDLIWSLFAN